VLIGKTIRHREEHYLGGYICGGNFFETFFSGEGEGEQLRLLN